MLVLLGSLTQTNVGVKVMPSASGLWKLASMIRGLLPCCPRHAAGEVFLQQNNSPLLRLKPAPYKGNRCTRIQNKCCQLYEVLHRCKGSEAN